MPRSQLVEEPRRASAASAGRLDAVAQLPVGGRHDDVTAVTDGNLPHHLLDDRVVARPLRVNRTYTCILTDPRTAPCVALENQDDLVQGKLGGHQLCVQPAGGARPVTPPAVGATAHDVRAVDDQNLHLASVGEVSRPFGVERGLENAGCAERVRSGLMGT